jgi:hypothetical protein
MKRSQTRTPANASSPSSFALCVNPVAILYLHLTKKKLYAKAFKLWLKIVSSQSAKSCPQESSAPKRKVHFAKPNMKQELVMLQTDA